MKPIKFKEANRNLTRPASMMADECGSLWVQTDGKTCVSCWKMSFSQRINALLYGRVWLGVHSGRTQPPVWIDCCETVYKEPRNYETRTI